MADDWFAALFKEATIPGEDELASLLVKLEKGKSRAKVIELSPEALSRTNDAPGTRWYWFARDRQLWQLIPPIEGPGSFKLVETRSTFWQKFRERARALFAAKSKSKSARRSHGS